MENTKFRIFNFYSY